jgi:hypothetical protein
VKLARADGEGTIKPDNATDEAALPIIVAMLNRRALDLIDNHLEFYREFITRCLKG